MRKGSANTHAARSGSSTSSPPASDAIAAGELLPFGRLVVHHTRPHPPNPTTRVTSKARSSMTRRALASLP